MKYIKRWDTFKNDNKYEHTSVNEYVTYSKEEKQQDLASLNNAIDKHFPDCEIVAHLVSQNENEHKISLYIRKLNFIPYNQDFIDKIQNNEHISLFAKDDYYNKQFKDMIEQISYMIKGYGFKFLDFRLSPTYKGKLEHQIISNKYKQ